MFKSAVAYLTFVAVFLTVATLMLILYPRQERILPETTIVTSIFLLNKSKHSREDFKSWGAKLTDTVTSPLVVFCDQQSISFLKDIWPQKKVKYIVLSNIWNFKLESFKTKYEDLWLLDPEKNIHSPEMYAVWNSKAAMVAFAKKNDFYNTKYFAWVDFGAWRDNTSFSNWPDNKAVDQLFKTYPSKHILVGLVTKPSEFTCQSFHKQTLGDEPAYRIDFVEGGFFVVDRIGAELFADKFYSLHDFWLSQGYFVGKDQTLFNAIIDDTFFFFHAYKAPPEFGDVWFRFRYLLHDSTKELYKKQGSLFPFVSDSLDC
ncbi:hypothetical protein GpartN1_g1806.t1 [Galdieria partita]|uniref:Uncharacterized protein n=1 Tax=Galdieria partita TaxID=83374 RepID=A0A9C7UP02_9RHOD|nr:hypothetical protein GpartN1_g1806.t1 [Galdieria partita]